MPTHSMFIQLSYMPYRMFIHVYKWHAPMNGRAPIAEFECTVHNHKMKPQHRKYLYSNQPIWSVSFAKINVRKLSVLKVTLNEIARI